MIALTRIAISREATGIYLRWYFNGWHYWCFTNNYDVVMKAQAMDVMTTAVYSMISKIERPTKVKTTYAYQVALGGMTAKQMEGFVGLLLAEMVEQYEGGLWREVDVTRAPHTVHEGAEPAFDVVFEVTRKELPNTPAVYQQTQYLYIGETLCDLDDDEVIAVNKQVNDIAEMQDRQSDFTRTFKIRKTRAMRALFELAGEVGATTNKPYEQQTCRLVQDGVELISFGKLVLDKSDAQYYYVSVYSGNLSFFKAIDGLKLQDLTLASADHDWTAANARDSQLYDRDYLYPLCEPSDDGGMIPLTDDGDRCELYTGWVWPCIKLRTIWNEIFTNAGYTAQGDILIDAMLAALWLPIASRKVDYVKIADLLYNIHVRNGRRMDAGTQDLYWHDGESYVTSYKGNAIWRNSSSYTVQVAGDYTVRATFMSPDNTSFPVHVYLYAGTVLLGELTGGGLILSISGGRQLWSRRYEGTFTCLVNYGLHLHVTYCLGVTRYSVEITNISAPVIAYGSTVPAARHLPAMTQTEFIKMVCNLFCLIPEVSAKDNTVLFWNYNKLYENIPQARDWSAYLSEADDDVEFKFGDYAQNNFMRFKASDDVVENTGTGVMQVDDATLDKEKDIIELPLATCDEVTVLTDVAVNRLNCNVYNTKDSVYDAQESIDPRIVFVDTTPDGSPAKTFGLRDSLVGGTSYDITTPKKASSLALAFGSRSEYYDGLARMLTKSNIRSCKFNLPVYEVAGFKHYIPVYLNQYKAYFYVNRILNYVHGKLCTIELIKL